MAPNNQYANAWNHIQNTWHIIIKAAQNDDCFCNTELHKKYWNGIQKSKALNTYSVGRVRKPRW